MTADHALAASIEQLKRERNAVILAHYYQEPDIQDIADFIGDSLELSRKAASTSADVIVFCGVHFMAETAKILSPEKTVLLPDVDAGCSLADDCPADDFASFRAQHPDHFVVSYINCTAAVKAQSDLICTSSNAVDSYGNFEDRLCSSHRIRISVAGFSASGQNSPWWPGAHRPRNVQ